MTANDPWLGPNARFLGGSSHPREFFDPHVGNALSVSLFVHALALLAILSIATRLAGPNNKVATLLGDMGHIAWITPGGGGSEGNNTPTPSRQLQRAGQDSLAIPSRSRSESQTLVDPTAPVINVPVVAMRAGVDDVPGLITAIAPVTTSGDGPGTGKQAGGGRGPGNGLGNGAGLDTGANGGPGGWLSGNGATSPRLIREVKPGYTSEAMRAHIQGMVRLQAIVLPDGSVGEARVVRSLDDRFGLDQEAVKTVKQWRFQPGMREGRAVPVVIEVELVFTLR